MIKQFKKHTDWTTNKIEIISSVWKSPEKKIEVNIYLKVQRLVDSKYSSYYYP